MKTVKRVSSDWDIYSGTVTINGNLVVVGQSTQVGSVNTSIADNVITLAAGQGGLVDAGIEVDRGSDPRAGLRWDHLTHRWQYSDDGLLWRTFSGTVVEDDQAPRLGGNLIVQNSLGADFWITHDPGRAVVVGPVVRLPQVSSDVSPEVDFSTIYAKKAESGDTGLFVANERAQAKELITKRKAFVYALIFQD